MKHIALIFSLATFCLYANAQKLPNVQQVSLRASTVIKIDGKAADWDNKYEAYNNATEVSYSISNNDKSLFLIIRSTSYAITNKIMRGGITITVNSAGRKDFTNASSITFPAAEAVELSGAIKAMRQLLENENTTEDEKLTENVNKQLASSLKFIKVSGLKDVGDSVVSVYNKHGLQAVANMTNKNTISCEFEIPINLIDLKTDKFTYNIKLNGPKLRRVVVPASADGLPAGNQPVNVFRGQGAINTGNMTPQQSQMVASTLNTDFWGEYTLAK